MFLVANACERFGLNLRMQGTVVISEEAQVQGFGQPDDDGAADHSGYARDQRNSGTRQSRGRGVLRLVRQPMAAPHSRTLLITAIFLISFFGHISADEPTKQSLLTIERSKNANIVQYDVQVDRDGLLNADEPVVAYWIRHADQGQIEELNWTQMKFAYGFSVDLADDRTTAELELKVDIGRPLIIRRYKGQYHAFLQINDQPAVLDTVFVKSTGKGVSTKVPYIDLKGRTLDGGEPVEDRIIP